TSPGSLAHAGKLTCVRHFAEARSAQPELAEHRPRAPAPLSTGVTADLELRPARGLDDQRVLAHQLSFNGKPRWRSSARPSSSVFAVVTTVISIPRGRSMVSGSISWNIDCSDNPNV